MYEILFYLLKYTGLIILFSTVLAFFTRHFIYNQEAVVMFVDVLDLFFLEVFVSTKIARFIQHLFCLSGKGS